MKRKINEKPKRKLNYFVPVVDKDNKPLMPTTLPRAFKWIKTRKATPFYKKGLFLGK